MTQTNVVKKHGYAQEDFDLAIDKQIAKMEARGVDDYTREMAIEDLAELGIRLKGTKSGWVDKFADESAKSDWQKIVAKIKKFNIDYPNLVATTGEKLRVGSYVQLKPDTKS